MTAKHTHQVAFGRRVEGCPRCAELSTGAPAIRWNIRTSDAQRISEIRQHDCRTSGCGPVCTFGDW